MFSVGLVGLPNAGKSTLSNLLTKRTVPAENFPFCTIEPHDGMVSVPDPRLDTLAKIASSEKVLPDVIEFRAIAGLVKGASKGEGLGNKFLSHIHEVDMILMVLRSFRNDDIVHVENRNKCPGSYPSCFWCFTTSTPISFILIAGLVKKYSQVLQRYYVQYLKGYDQSELTQVCNIYPPSCHTKFPLDSTSRSENFIRAKVNSRTK